MEFTDKWVEFKLKDIININPKSTDLPNEFYYIDLESVNNGRLVKNLKKVKLCDAPSRAQRLLCENDILFQTVRPYQKNNFLFLINNNNVKYVSSTGYAQLRSNININSLFMFYLLHTFSFVKNVLSWSTGSNYPAINSNDLSKIKVKIPSFKEQKKIGNMFSQIDSKIKLLEQKLTFYQKFKKGLLQQIFTQKLQFKKYLNSNWKTVQLKNIVSIPKKVKIQTVDGLNLLTVKLHTKGIEINDKIKPKITKKGRPYYIRHYNEILIGRQNFHNGGIGIVPKYLDGGICSNAITSLNVLEDKVNIDYLYYYMGRYDYYKRAEKFIGGTGQKEFSETELLKLKINMPSLEEQEKIANFLSAVDKKIDLIQSQIQKMEEFKKGLLQQMFI